MKRTALLTLLLLLGLGANASGIKVEAPESPFGFQPLLMHEFPDKDFNITRYGAEIGNAAANQKAINKAMVECSKAGGGRVVIPEGEWISGPIEFRSGCNLFLSEGAKLLISDDLSLYRVVQTAWGAQECMNWTPLVRAFECENVAITGTGTLEAKMDLWRTWFSRPPAHLAALQHLCLLAASGVPVEQRVMAYEGANMRPSFVEFNRCTNVQLADFKLRQSPCWCLHLFLCKDVWVHGVDAFADGHNSDGIDLNMTQHVILENTSFCQSDDAICIKSGRNQDGWRLGVPTTDVVIRRCNVIRGGAIIAIGSEISAGVQRIYAHDCEGHDMSRFINIKTNERRGGVVEDVMLENCYGERLNHCFRVATDVMYQYRDLIPTFEVRRTVIRNITLKNVKVDWTEVVADICGDKDQPIRNITIDGIDAGEVTHYISRFDNVIDLKLDNVTVKNYSRTGEKKKDFHETYRKYMKLKSHH